MVHCQELIEDYLSSRGGVKRVVDSGRPLKLKLTLKGKA
jgi:hypothetical protein